MQSFKTKYIPFEVEDDNGVRYFAIGKMTGDQRDDFMELSRASFIIEQDADGKPKPRFNPDVRIKPHAILYFCLYPANADGVPTSKTLVTRDIVNGLTADALEWATEQAQTLNSFGPKGVEEAKKSGSVQSGESGTASPSDSAAPSEKPSNE